MEPVVELWSQVYTRVIVIKQPGLGFSSPTSFAK